MSWQCRKRYVVINIVVTVCAITPIVIETVKSIVFDIDPLKFLAIYWGCYVLSCLAVMAVWKVKGYELSHIYFRVADEGKAFEARALSQFLTRLQFIVPAIGALYALGFQTIVYRLVLLWPTTTHAVARVLANVVSWVVSTVIGGIAYDG